MACHADSSASRKQRILNIKKGQTRAAYASAVLPLIPTAQVTVPGGAAERLREDVASACNKFAFMGLKIVGSEAGVDEHEG